MLVYLLFGVWQEVQRFGLWEIQLIEELHSQREPWESCAAERTAKRTTPTQTVMTKQQDHNSNDRFTVVLTLFDSGTLRTCSQNIVTNKTKIIIIMQLTRIRTLYTAAQILAILWIFITSNAGHTPTCPLDGSGNQHYFVSLLLFSHHKSQYISPGRIHRHVMQLYLSSCHTDSKVKGVYCWERRWWWLNGRFVPQLTGEEKAAIKTCNAAKEKKKKDPP